MRFQGAASRSAKRERVDLEPLAMAWIGLS